MSEGLIGVIFVCLTVVVVAVIIAVVQIRKMQMEHPRPEDEARQRYLKASDEAPAKLYGEQPAYEYSRKTSYPVHHSGDVPDEVNDPAPAGEGPAPFDPENPPTTKTYRRKPGSTASVPRCYCHNRELKEGQTVLWWPLPDNGGVRIYCQREDA